MVVKDLDLIKNIELLFEGQLIVWGAGRWGQEILSLLEDAEVPVAYVCDKNARQELDGHQMIAPEQLKEIEPKESYNLIIGSLVYADEMLSWMEREGIDFRNVFSVGGILHSIALNLDSIHFKPAFCRQFRKQQASDWEKWDALGFSNMTMRMFLLFHIYQSPGVIVYQPGKVGSNTVYAGLERYEVPCLHLHTLKYFGNNQFLIEDYLRNSSSKIKIITLVREPIARDIAFYFEWLSHKFIRSELVKKDIVTGVEEFLEREEDSPYTEEFAWFDNEIKELTGIDIFQHSFDRERGFGIIREGKWEILVLKLEKLNGLAEIIGEFVGVPGLRLENVNVGTEKLYRFTYSEAKKRLKISDKMLKKYYSANERLGHFYSDKEIEDFMRKYGN